MKGKKPNLIIKNKERLCTRAPMRISFAGGGTDINHYFQMALHDYLSNQMMREDYQSL